MTDAGNSLAMGMRGDTYPIHRNIVAEAFRQLHVVFKSDVSDQPDSDLSHSGLLSRDRPGLPE